MKNLIGLRIGLLTVINYSHMHTQPCGAKVHYWKVKCDCGKEFARKGPHLTSKRMKEDQSCGCAVPSQVSKRFRLHGLKKFNAYESWAKMIRRCYNPKDRYFKHYGGRGIRVDPLWHSAENFFADMGERPKWYSLERIDFNKNYCKENCKWIPLSQQSKNRRTNVKLSANGETLSQSEWARRLKVSHTSIAARLRKGWSEVDAITIPFKN